MHISAKIQPKNLKQYFDWGGGPGPLGYALDGIARASCIARSGDQTSGRPNLTQCCKWLTTTL